MSAFIINFQSPKELIDLIDRFTSDGLTNIDHILHFDDTLMEWTVDKNCSVGDEVYFMCAKTSKDHMRRVLSEARLLGDNDIIAFAEEKLMLYKEYAGKIVATGSVIDEPFQTDNSGYEFPAWRNPWYAKIGSFILLDNPVGIDDFRSFITVSRTGSITRLTKEQTEKLKGLIGDNKCI